MPVIPSDTTNLPSTASNSSNQNEPQKATAQDHLSKGPQIPDSKYCEHLLYILSRLTEICRYATQSFPGRNRSTQERAEQMNQSSNG